MAEHSTWDRNTLEDRLVDKPTMTADTKETVKVLQTNGPLGGTNVYFERNKIAHEIDQR